MTKRTKKTTVSTITNRIAKVNEELAGIADDCHVLGLTRSQNATQRMVDASARLADNVEREAKADARKVERNAKAEARAKAKDIREAARTDRRAKRIEVLKARIAKATKRLEEM